MAASVSSCPSLPIGHRRPAAQILFQQQPPTGDRWFTSNAVQSRRRPCHVVASAATTDRPPAPVPGDYYMDRGSPLAEASGRSGDGQLAARWREIHGSGNWEGLLDPIDAVLRAELIRYGELAQATYDSFDYDRFSPYCGSCRFPAKTFFRDVGLDGAGYEVSRFLYATGNDLRLPNFGNRKHVSTAAAAGRLWSESGTFIGFVAASNDEETARIGRRDIAVAWRGTITRLEWVADLTANQRRVSDMGVPCPDPGVKVEMGFAELYTGKDAECRFCRYSAREQALAEVRKLVELYHGRGEEVSVTVTGHSLGSALAMLSAFDIAETGANATPDGRTAPVCVFSFAGPRVGNLKFRERFERVLGVRALRVVNVHDRVPKVPGVFFNEAAFPEAVLRAVDGLGLGGVYTHLGVPLALDHTASPFLKETLDISCYHNLEAHLHLLDGFRSAGEGFELRGRDPALVNKSADFLRDDHMVPPVWYQAENKGMVRTEDGRWVLPPRHRDIDEHPADTDHHLQQLGLTAST
ncbi:Phospholipase A1-Igamma1, chloroplastic [Dichanthelium oligosanthes]|uniref:Phospholipase A1-Igamma1, chloroplastic n=1 Tax=Dichanthelium oligosanthes TaxID=888268 RepID=A0A1E5VJY6_9POAL|nr:Phospholipase A1-Igamma1, chloroplastic [Dichanthelium oligosanthes]